MAPALLHTDIALLQADIKVDIAFCIGGVTSVQLSTDREAHHVHGPNQTIGVCPIDDDCELLRRLQTPIP